MAPLNVKENSYKKSNINICLKNVDYRIYVKGIQLYLKRLIVALDEGGGICSQGVVLHAVPPLESQFNARTLT